MKKILAILFLNLFGAGLLFSFLDSAGHALWQQVDNAVFLFFNRLLTPGSFFLYLTAISNVRAFDAVSFICMALLYSAYFRRADAQGKRRMLVVGLLMLTTAVMIKQCSDFYPITHPSPTRLAWQEPINRISQLTDFGAKDNDANSFPGDHGMMLMVFAAFMARYHGRKAFAASALIVVLFAMPRIMGGGHWFSDVYMGSLATVCLLCPWVLLTPLSDWLVARLAPFVPGFLTAKCLGNGSEGAHKA